MGLDFCWFWRWVAVSMGPTKPRSEPYCRLKLRRPPLLLPPISPPCSPQLAANLSQSSCWCEIWDGAVDLRFGMVPMGLRFLVVGSGVVL